jgi:Lrp/AsnC family leucine-responsive transcriptional regulator
MYFCGGNCMVLDKIDKKILNLLQVNARLSNQDMADEVGLSPSACLRRFKSLENSGIILGYKPILNTKKLGLDMTVLLQVSVDKHSPEQFASFEKAVAKLPNVVECLLLTGQSADYQLRVVVKDLEQYQDILLNHITQIKGVGGVHSSFVLREVVKQVFLPIK